MPNILTQAALRKIVRRDAEATRRHARFLKDVADEREARLTAEDDGDERDGDGEIGNNGSAADHHASKLATLLTEAADGKLRRPEILSWLFHHRDGRSLVRAFKRQQIEHPAPSVEKDMSTTENLIDVAKRFGAINVAKRIVKTGDAATIPEHDFTSMLLVDAERFRKDGETVPQSFARLFGDPGTEGFTIRKAYAIVKAGATLDVQPLYVGGEAAQNVNDPAEALAQLQELGRRRWPDATSAQQFARAFSDPANATLAAKAHQRPQPTTSFAFPR